MNNFYLAFYVTACVRPNQSLKLTEPAVDDLSARQKIFKGKAMSAARIFYH